jgi:hypothetical protein
VLQHLITFKNFPYSLNVEFHNVGGYGTNNYHWILNGEILNRLTTVEATSLGMKAVLLFAVSSDRLHETPHSAHTHTHTHTHTHMSMWRATTQRETSLTCHEALYCYRKPACARCARCARQVPIVRRRADASHFTTPQSAV